MKIDYAVSANTDWMNQELYQAVITKNLEGIDQVVEEAHLLCYEFNCHYEGPCSKGECAHYMFMEMVHDLMEFGSSPLVNDFIETLMESGFKPNK